MKKSKLIKKYEHVREQCRSDLVIQWATLTNGFIPGARMVIATIEMMPMPVGTLWIAHGDGGTASILTAYVEPWARRCGILTALHREVIRAYPHLASITSGIALSKASKKWMLAQGYRKRKDGSWKIKIRKGQP